MPWFDKLKDLIRIDITIKDLINIHINSNNVSERYEYDDSHKSLSINLERLFNDDINRFLLSS